MTALEFYRITTETLEELAKRHCVRDLEKYYSLTDFLAFPQLKDLGEIEQTYMQIAFHGQNATLISNIIRFEKNYPLLEDILCGFSPEKVINKYCAQASSPVEAEDRLLHAFTEKGISSDLHKSSVRPNAILAGYVSMLLDAAAYLKEFRSKQEVIADLMRNYPNGEAKALVTYFRSRIRSRFSVALTCDFLKEYSEVFDLPKPDIHIKDTLCAVKGLEKNYYRTEKREYECIRHMQELVDEINLALAAEKGKKISVYQLDRMIWLICSDNFFLDDTTTNSKEDYLKKIKCPLNMCAVL